MFSRAHTVKDVLGGIIKNYLLRVPSIRSISENSRNFPGGGETTLYQLELDYRKIDCGMSYVVKTRSGAFFIVDGGYFTDGEEDRLYHFLKERSDGDIHIAGWFFSHAHQDHVGNFINFVKKYCKVVQIDRLYYNIQKIDFSIITGDWKSCDEATAREFFLVIRKYIPEVPVTILKTGQKFSVGELKFEVLFTHHDLESLPASFNDHSTVLMMKVGKQKILWLGDIGTKGSQALMRMPKKKLACDIVQVAHHGYNGGTLELYSALGARVALWPTPENRMESNESSDVNNYILKQSRVKEHIVSGMGTAEMKFPYVYKTANQFKKQFE